MRRHRQQARSQPRYRLAVYAISGRNTKEKHQSTGIDSADHIYCRCQIYQMVNKAVWTVDPTAQRCAEPGVLPRSVGHIATRSVKQVNTVARRWLKSAARQMRKIILKGANVTNIVIDNTCSTVVDSDVGSCRCTHPDPTRRIPRRTYSYIPFALTPLVHFDIRPNEKRSASHPPKASTHTAAQSPSRHIIGRSPSHPMNRWCGSQCGGNSMVPKNRPKGAL